MRVCNFFNTAEVYSQGVAEEMLGKALGSRRKDVIIISKISYHVKPGQNTAGLSRKHIVEACEASLKRLGTDYIDIYEAHGLDPRTAHEITLSAMNDLVHQGKARYIGCSNYAGWNLMKGLAISEKNGWEKFVTLEAMYSLASRAAGAMNWCRPVSIRESRYLALQPSACRAPDREIPPGSTLAHGDAHRHPAGCRGEMAC